ncbi:MAG: hypothetical protein GC204_15580 [Chloroflexi bacterium]|nr:hypothetical protein [Chloroflexota bacterium]
MKSLNVEELRALIRLIPAARALQEEVEKSVHLEMFAGTSELAVRSFHGLQQSVYAITNDRYVEALTIQFDDGTPEKQIIAQVILAASQLIAYIEGQAGVVGLTGPHRYSIQTAPNVTLNMDGFSGGQEETSRIMETIDRAIRFRPTVPPSRPPTPRVPPAPPMPPIPPIPSFEAFDPFEPFGPPEPPEPFGWQDEDSFDEDDH